MKEDLRVQKTKAALYRGLMELMKDIPFDEIKVQDICKKSLVNRSTFYDHFGDKYELLDSLMKNMQIELNESIHFEKKINTIKEYYMELIKIILEHIDKEKSVYQSVVKINGNSIARDMMIKLFIESTTNEINNNFINESNIPTKKLVLFHASGIISIIYDYLLDTNKFDKDEIYTILDKLIIEQNSIKKKEV